MKKIYTSEDRFFVQLTKDALEGEGYECCIRNQFASSSVGEAPPQECWPEVWLFDDAKYDGAIQFLQERFESTQQGTVWKCKGCGETNEPSFEICWKCGTDVNATALINITPGEILEFWFSEQMSSHWFSATPELDREIRERFESLWKIASRGSLDDWCDTPEGCVALTIILDQFPLNMFRGQAKSFATERKAIDTVLVAVDRGLNQQIENERLIFLYMPLMHSEVLAEQDLSVKLFKATHQPESIRFAEHHREIVREFGRFPHRNAILGRESSEEEQRYLVSDRAYLG